MELWLNIESGIEFKKYTLEVGLYLMQWKLSYRLSKGGLKTLRLGPFYFCIWDNNKLRAWHEQVIENNPYGPRDED